MYKIKINQNKIIGENEYPFIIAEIGNNHNGNLDTAIKLIESAKKAGADAVKFQVKNIEKSFAKELLDSPYVNENSFGKTYREHKMALEFSEEQMKQLYDFAAKINIICFSTPFDIDSVDMLERIGNPIYKISSFHVTDLKLIEYVCQTKKPIIISTGMSTIEEIDKAIELIKKYTKDFVIMHCVSCYPTEDKDVNLNIIPTLKNRYNCPVGYSGHERGIAISASTVLLGSCAIERHFTLDRTMKGPDHASSVEPVGLNDIVTRSKKFFVSMGKSEKDVLDCELQNRKKFRGY
jgi:sialic acid synthase SpsE